MYTLSGTAGCLWAYVRVEIRQDSARIAGG